MELVDRVRQRLSYSSFFTVADWLPRRVYLKVLDLNQFDAFLRHYCP